MNYVLPIFNFSQVVNIVNDFGPGFINLIAKYLFEYKAVFAAYRHDLRYTNAMAL